MLPLLARTARVLLLAAWALLPALASPPPRQVRVAAAADLKWALEEARVVFEQAHPGTLCTLTFGSSGTFYGQLTQKAPFDLFLSADLDYPRRLAEQGLGLKETLFTYAVGHLVVWVPKASPIPVESLGIRAVRHPGARRIALANPGVAPYGRAAEAALRSTGLLEDVKARLVLGENVAQAAQFVQTGNADLGLISKSLAASAAMKGQGRHAEVPEGLHPPLEQGGVVLAWARDREAALAFRAFLLGSEGQALLRRHGFSAPGGN
ncbi:MAG: molybdate ABC transporter substrate-binding protein [Holophagaceae bacterium]